jgi:diphosphomevalonate decarboxylase
MSNPFKNIQGEVCWRSPSNIALVKYWGKYGNQLPRNASISFTLNNAYSEMSMKYQPKASDNKKIELKFYFDEKKIQSLKQKFKRF